jgi:hypothetical protein
MNRKLKALGLALVAVAAMTALSAAPASAVWHGEKTGTVKGINIEGEEVFTTNAGNVKCEISEYNGTTTATTPGAVKVKPTYKNCQAFGFIGTPIDVGTCEYEFTTPVKTTSTVHIVNCATPLRVTAFNCEITVGNQGPLSHITWTQGGVPSPPNIHDLIAHVTITGIKYTQHSKSFPGCTNGTFTNGTYTGTNTVRAYDSLGNQVPITVT